MTIAVQYSRPSSGLTGAEIFGLDVAVNNLLGNWFRYGGQEKYLVRPTSEDSFQHCQTLAQSVGIAPEKLIGIDPRYPAETLNKVHCLVQPDPLIADLAWLRRQIPGAGYALCGLIHTMSSNRIAQAVNELCIAPTCDSDALICPSHAIKAAVKNLWLIYADYLEYRFGRPFTCPVQLPVIPLGVDTEKFSACTTPTKRAAQRAALGAAEDEIILLFMGRLSFATKAHPAPLYMAAEHAACQTGKKIRLVMYGYYKPEMMADAFQQLGADFCQTVSLEFILNTDPRFPEGLWAGADIFISLVDNIQESFGLTPIEAMASGLPVIVTDWDGYRDAVRDGTDGFTIRTIAPPAATGQLLAERFGNQQDNYGEYLTATAQSTALDIAQTTEAIVRLAGDAGLRRRMGASGRQRAQADYDWQHIIKAYSELWEELGQRRRRNPPAGLFPPQWPAASPAYPNPYAMFDGFPSTTLVPSTRLRRARDDTWLANVLKHEMNYFVPAALLDQAGLVTLAARMTTYGVTLEDIVAHYPPAQRDAVWRSCGWLLKFGICVRDDTA